MSDVAIDRANVAAYAAVTGLRYGDTVPLTYPFALTFPDRDVTDHRLRLSLSPQWVRCTSENQITRYRPIAVTDTVSVQNARREPARAPQGTAGRRRDRRQRRQRRARGTRRRRSCTSSGPASPTSPKRHRPSSPSCHPPIRYCASHPARSAVTPRWAGITTRSTPAASAPSSSVSPPQLHTECSVPQQFWPISRVNCPSAVRYSVKFGKPVILPASAGLYVDRVENGWDLSLRNMSKGYPHLTGEDPGAELPRQLRRNGAAPVGGPRGRARWACPSVRARTG